MRICVWFSKRGAWGQTRPGGRRSDCTGCPGSRRQRSPSAGGWSEGWHSTLREHKDTVTTKPPHSSLLYVSIGSCWRLTIKKLGVNVAQDIHNSQLLSRTGAPVDPKPGGFCQSSAQRSDGQGSGQGRHQAPLRLLGQRGASSSPPCRRDSRTRRGVHNYPIFLSSVGGFVWGCGTTKRLVCKVS